MVIFYSCKLSFLKTKNKNYNMKLIKFIKHFFWKSERTHNPFSEAISEGIKETFKEMGYKVRLNDKT